MKEILLLTGLSMLMLCTHAQGGKSPHRFPTEEMIIYDICFTQYGGALGIADGKSVKVYSTTSQELIREFKNGHSGRVLSIDISSDSAMLVSGGMDSTLVLWDFHSGNRTGVVRYEGVIASVSVSPDNSYLAFGGSGKTAVLYDIKNEKILYLLSDHSDDITSVAFSSDGKYVATAGGDKLIHIYRIENGSLVGRINGHKGWVRDISFSPDGSRLLSGGDDSKIIQWDMTDINSITKQVMKKAYNSWILSLDFHNEKNTYAYGNLNGEAVIFSQFMKYELKVKAPVQRILFKPDKENLLTIAIATRGKGVLLVDAMDMNLK